MEELENNLGKVSNEGDEIKVHGISKPGMSNDFEFFFSSLKAIESRNFKYCVKSSANFSGLRFYHL